MKHKHTVTQINTNKSMHSETGLVWQNPIQRTVWLYGVALWSYFSGCIMTKFKYCYNKSMKKFFGYTKYYSVTEMVLELGLPSFDTVIHNYRNLFLSVWSNHSDDMVKLLRCVCPSAFLLSFTVFYCTSCIAFFLSFTYTVSLSVCLSLVHVYGPCCLI